MQFSNSFLLFVLFRIPDKLKDINQPNVDCYNPKKVIIFWVIETFSTLIITFIS